ncbi:hypothetical protein HKX48_005384 [Thoreauomyces humboldtii]|nr:hypothetical protein HKX48_005384 [Thoreauomyces humboldtii]
MDQTDMNEYLRNMDSSSSPSPLLKRSDYSHHSSQPNSHHQSPGQQGQQQHQSDPMHVHFANEASQRLLQLQQQQQQQQQLEHEQLRLELQEQHKRQQNELLAQATPLPDWQLPPAHTYQQQSGAVQSVDGSRPQMQVYTQHMPLHQTLDTASSQHWSPVDQQQPQQQQQQPGQFNMEQSVTHDTTSPMDTTRPSQYDTQAFTHFRTSPMEYDALISPYITGDMSTLLQPDELELLLTPLISPAMTPSADFQQLSLHQLAETFSPLTSPALGPQRSDYSANQIYLSPALNPFPGLDGASPFALTPAVVQHSNNTFSHHSHSPALGPSSSHLVRQTGHVGQSPGLHPVDSSTWPPQQQQQQQQQQPPRRQSMNSPLLTALRDKSTKKIPLASPYTIPRKNSGGVLISPALKPSSSHSSPANSTSGQYRKRSSISPESGLQQESPGTSPAGSSLTPPGTVELGPVFKEPFPIKQKKAVIATDNAATSRSSSPMISPALTPQLGPTGQEGNATGGSLAPVTPAQLMQMGDEQVDPVLHTAKPPPPPPVRPAQEPAKIQPIPLPQLPQNANGSGSGLGHALISPSLKPLLPNGAKTGEAAVRLTEKSNYQNMREGKTETIGLNYEGDVTTTVEAKRDCHKQAEQRRRDTLKHSFEELRHLLPPIEEKNPSKVLVLKKCCEYVQILQKRDEDMRKELEELRREVDRVNGGDTFSLAAD